MTDASSIYHKARAEVASMLRLQDVDNLTGEDAIRLDVGTSLRVLMDNQSGRLLRGESLDARELLAASEALSRILPPLREPPSAPREDPRQFMWQTYLGMRQRGELDPTTYDGQRRRIAELEAKVAELEAALAAPATAVPPAPLPPNVVPMRPATSEPAAPAAPPKPVPPPPAAASAPVLGDLVMVVDPSPQEKWKSYVEPTGEIRSTPRGPGRYWGPV